MNRLSPLERSERERLITAHIGLVHQIVGRIGAHLPENVDRDDLVSAGILGLIKAVDRYDANKGAKLATYASTVIRGEVMEWLRSKDWAPRSVRRKAREVARTAARLEYAEGRPPTEHEVAEAMGMDIDEYRRVLSETATASLLSLDDQLSPGEDDWDGEPSDPSPLVDFGDPAAQVEKETVRRLLVEAVDGLPEREKQVIGLYYQHELTLREIGEVLGVTESRVCQIHGQAIARLRGYASRELAIAVPR